MKESPAYLAFDLGASSSRAILGILEDGKMLMQTLHRFETPILEKGGSLYWDIDALWNDMQTGLEKALNAAPGLKSLSVDSWGVDYVRLDAAGKPIDLPFCYRDERTKGMMDLVFATMPAEAIYKQTGIQFLPFNTLYQAVADQQQNPAPKPALHLSIADYFNYRFSGKAVWDVSMASTTQMKTVDANTWDPAIFDALGLDQQAWPPIVPSGTVLGPAQVNPAIQVVATCSHDTGCAVAAAPAAVDQKHWAYISCGTWSLLGRENAEPIVTDAARQAGFTHEMGVDGTYRFLKNIVGLWVLQECIRAWGIADDWAALTTAAAAAASPDFTLDLTDERFIARGNMPARIAAYCEAEGFSMPTDNASIVRLILESLAANFAENLSLLEQVTGEAVDVIHLFGGGSQNELLCQLTANATGRTVVAGPVEATALGNLLIQARAMGDLGNDASIRSIARASSELTSYVHAG